MDTQNTHKTNKELHTKSGHSQAPLIGLTMKRMSTTEFLDADIAAQRNHFGPIIKSPDRGYVLAEIGVDPEPVVAEMAVAITCGKRFAGQGPKRARNVVIVAASATLKKLQKNIASSLRGRDIEAPAGLTFYVPTSTNVKIDSHFDPQHLLPDLNDDWDMAIVDSRLPGVHGGGAPGEMNPGFSIWTSFAQMRGKTVVIIFRSSIGDSKQPSSAKLRGSDFLIYVQSQVTDPDQGSTTFGLSMQSVHRGLKPPIAVTAVMTTDAEGAATWTHEKGVVNEQDRCIARAKQMHEKGMSNTDIGAELGVDRRKVGRWLLA